MCRPHCISRPTGLIYPYINTSLKVDDRQSREKRRRAKRQTTARVKLCSKSTIVSYSSDRRSRLNRTFLAYHRVVNSFVNYINIVAIVS
jgi:hypothetical protein